MVPPPSCVVLVCYFLDMTCTFISFYLFCCLFDALLLWFCPTCLFGILYATMELD